MSPGTSTQPLHPPALDWILGQVYFCANRYEDVIRVLMGEAMLNSVSHAFLTAAFAHLGRDHEAHQALSAFIAERHKEFASRDLAVKSETISTLAGGYRKMWRNQSDWQHLADGLRKAGLPE